jgi:maltooligosyltrehalose trehalohydrolase
VRLGAELLPDRNCKFTVWAPQARRVRLHLVSPLRNVLSLDRVDKGYWTTSLVIPPKTQYFYSVDSKTRLPDPASQYQPRGVHGPSQVIEHALFHWQDRTWQGIDVSKMIIYELHVGTFTPKGSLSAIIPRLKELKKLGINTLEIMPVTAFPGKRNWGKDWLWFWMSFTSLWSLFLEKTAHALGRGHEF